MDTKYYINIKGKYIGGFTSGTGINLIGYIEVPYPPEDATYIWDGSQWILPVIE